jgi:putative transposase
MKITAQVKLNTTELEKEALLKTMVEFNEVCDGISVSVFESKIFKQFSIHKMLYYPIRDSFDLSAQLVVRAISKVSDSYKLDQLKRRSFRKYGAVTFDGRILTWKENEVSIWTLEGRKKIPFLAGEKQREQLSFQKGETDLIYKNGDFFLYATCEIPEKEMVPSEQFLGVDMGIVNIATDSLETIYSGSHMNSVRIRNLKLRAKLQSKGSQSAKKLLRKRRRKERLFTKDTNHRISKKIVETAQRHSVGIALENLKGVRKRVTVKKGLRYQLHSWAFNDLLQKVWYKAKKEGIEVKLVDPKYTSQECSSCGNIKRSNRKSQSLFSCQSCGYTVHADVNAACNISSRAAVNRPYVVGLIS